MKYFIQPREVFSRFPLSLALSVLHQFILRLQILSSYNTFIVRSPFHNQACRILVSTPLDRILCLGHEALFSYVVVMFCLGEYNR
jgi:hypothetical protein